MTGCGGQSWRAILDLVPSSGLTGLGVLTGLEVLLPDGDQTIWRVRSLRIGSRNPRQQAGITCHPRMNWLHDRSRPPGFITALPQNSDLRCL